MALIEFVGGHPSYTSYVDSHAALLAYPVGLAGVRSCQSSGLCLVLGTATLITR